MITKFIRIEKSHSMVLELRVKWAAVCRIQVESAQDRGVRVNVKIKKSQRKSWGIQKCNLQKSWINKSWFKAV